MIQVPPARAFTFFEDPRNLIEITPDWLDFRIVTPTEKLKVHRGAEFDFTIRWLGLRMSWRSKITEYEPPERFIDLQLIGPYRYWSHLHTFEPTAEGTLLRDEITYKVPFGHLGTLFHDLLIKRRLEDIFRYRAMRISEWATGNFRWKRKDNSG